MTVRGVSAAAAVVVAAGLVVAGFVGALRPLHANGVTGNAIAPRYHPFDVGVASYQPLPEHVTIADLRRLGVRVPQDAVDERRRLAAGLVAGGLVTAGVGGMSAAALRAGRRAGGGSPAG